MYLSFGWVPNNDKILAVPAPSFFGDNVITPDNIEYGVFSQSVNPVSKYVEFLLTHGQEFDNFGEMLSPLNVRYVILVHEADFQNYGYLRQQKDLRAVLDLPGITLFHNAHPHGPAYGVDNVRTLAKLEELVELGRIEDVSSNVYVLDAGANSKGPLLGTGTAPVFPVVQRTHPARFELGETKRPYTVFVTKYGTTSRHWRFKGQGPEMMNLGMMPVYGGDGSAGTVFFSRWAWLLALDSLALFMAAVSTTYLLWPWLKARVVKEDVNGSCQSD